MLTLKMVLEALGKEYNHVSIQIGRDHTSRTDYPNDGYEHGITERNADIIRRYGADAPVLYFDHDGCSCSYEIALKSCDYVRENMGKHSGKRKHVEIAIDFWSEYIHFYGDETLNADDCKQQLFNDIRSGKITFTPDGFDLNISYEHTW